MAPRNPRRSRKRSIEQRLASVEATLRKLAEELLALSGSDIDEFRWAVDQVHKHNRDLRTQLNRIAEIQAELDDLKRTWQRMKSTA